MRQFTEPFLCFALISCVKVDLGSGSILDARAWHLDIALRAPCLLQTVCFARGVQYSFFVR